MGTCSSRDGRDEEGSESVIVQDPWIFQLDCRAAVGTTAAHSYSDISSHPSCPCYRFSCYDSGLRGQSQIVTTGFGTNFTN